jgi:hypothetical protein
MRRGRPKVVDQQLACPTTKCDRQDGEVDRVVQPVIAGEAEHGEVALQVQGARGVQKRQVRVRWQELRRELPRLVLVGRIPEGKAGGPHCVPRSLAHDDVVAAAAGEVVLALRAEEPRATGPVVVDCSGLECVRVPQRPPRVCFHRHEGPIGSELHRVCHHNFVSPGACFHPQLLIMNRHDISRSQSNGPHQNCSTRTGMT